MFLYISKKEEDTQRHIILKIKCTIKERVCDLIIDSGSSENIVCKTMVDKLQLKTHKHPSFYCIRWIKDVGETKVTKQCHIPFSIRRCKDEVTCNVVNMNADHMSLGRL